MSKIFLLLLFFFPLHLFPQTPESNILLWGDTVQVTSEINEYENIRSGMPINGSVMITYNTKNAIDANSFMLGSAPLKVKFIRSVPMSSSGSLMVNIYQFQLEGMKTGTHFLPPIKVKVGGKYFEAAPLTVNVSG